MSSPSFGTSHTPTLILARPQLQRAGVASYRATDPALLAAWLEQRGWQKADPRSPSEHARFWCGPRLIVVYNTGTALIQGLQPELTHALLSELAGGAR
jgi:hypothetical protein